MEGFSSGLRLTGLDDRITPSQTCVKPVVVDKTGAVGRATIELEDDGSYVELVGTTRRVLEKATISLTDCLACSGCITSAESVLIEQQSSAEFLAQLASPKGRTFVVTVSPQARASIAAHFGLSALQTHRKLVSYFKQIGCEYMFDASFSREFTLLETLAEFVDRFKNKNRLPLLTSACPGWVCYAEKKHGDFILPYISTAKSPQQVMGTLVKGLFASSIGKTSQDVYHVTLMPCFDKKLEASRPDFITRTGGQEVRDVDCVLTSLEVIEVMRTADVDFCGLPESPVESLYTLIDGATLTGREGVSGGYSSFVLRGAAKILFGKDISECEVVHTAGRNADFVTTELRVDGNVLLSFCVANGFNNIQNVVRRLKSSTTGGAAVPRRRKRTKGPRQPLHFVEVMACPSGCTNGGGQVRPEGREDAKTLLARVVDIYSEVSTGLPPPPDTSKVARKMYDDWVGGEPGSVAAIGLLHTQYHAVAEPEPSALNTTW